MYHNWQSYVMYGSWDIKHNRQYFIILGHFLPFDPPNKQKNFFFEKMKTNVWRYYHFTYMYHNWQSYVMYGSWDIKHNRQYFIILGHFYHFNPTPSTLTTQKIWKNCWKNWKMKKLHRYIIILHKCFKNHMLYILIVGTPPPFLQGGRGGLSLLPNFQKGRGLTGPQPLEGVAGKEGGNFLQGVAIFT